MSDVEMLASRLRQAIQGCSIHNHGPVQAWAAIERASAEGLVQSAEVARWAIQACVERIRVLKEQGAGPSDLRIQKEEITRAFIEKLFAQKV